MRPKKFDIFILKSFLLLLAGTVFICLFVLLMNVLWRFVDILVGKGFSVGVLAKFFYYSALTMVPQALPLAVLLAALITFGNFGERFELTAMKTAGISLLRVMRPLTVLCVVLVGISFYFQNVTGPNATRKLYSLIVSMQQKSPELEIPEGSFYDEIAGYNLYVRDKDNKTGWLYGLTIYDISRGFEDIRVIAADSGRLETTADKKHLYLHLYSGEQFENMQAQNMSRKSNPYRREIFGEKHILIDFNSDFNLIDDNLMSSQAAVKSMGKIKYDIDSLSSRQDSLGVGNLHDFNSALTRNVRYSEKDSAMLASSLVAAINVDSLFMVSSRSSQLDYRKQMRQSISGQTSELMFKGNSMSLGDKNIRTHWIEWMKKITLCLSILVFFYIGAPLGAIIRKGGLGVPVIVSVFTYILFYLTSSSGEKMFREGAWSIIGCWLGVLVLLPLSIFFTVAANKDSTVFQMDVYKEFFRYWFGGKVNRNIVYKDVVIDDPDKDRCQRLAADIKAVSRRILSEGRIGKVPDYMGLFFRGVEDAEMRGLSGNVESLVEELANSRDNLELELLNSFPVMPVYGIESPFANRTANRIIGAIVPIGLLFWLRAWLFSLQLSRQLVKTEETAGYLDSYLRTGNFEDNL